MEAAFTINAAGRDPEIPFTAHRLRILLKEGRLKGFGFFAGSRFYLLRDKIPELVDELTNGTSERATKGA